jgi:hypothetical protein
VNPEKYVWDSQEKRWKEKKENEEKTKKKEKEENQRTEAHAPTQAQAEGKGAKEGERRSDGTAPSDPVLARLRFSTPLVAVPDVSGKPHSTDMHYHRTDSLALRIS